LSIEREIEVPKKVYDQVSTIRDTGYTNMFDINNVQNIAEQLGFTETVEWLETKENKVKLFEGIMKGLKPI
jgi:hypothetical protein